MNDAAERLDECLVQAIDPASDTSPEKSSFRIENKEMAIWALRKIAFIERNRKEARAAAQAEKGRIEAWLADEEKRANQARGYLDFLLEDYHRRYLAENPKAKTIKLPHGELQFRVQQPEYQYDEAVVKDWAKENSPVFIVQPKPPEPGLDWANLKKYIQLIDGKVVDPATGEVIPGITVIERPLKFNIKLTEL